MIKLPLTTKYIEKKMQSRNVTAYGLAKDLGLTPSAAYKWFTDGNVNIEYVGTIAKILQISRDELEKRLIADITKDFEEARVGRGS